MNKTLSMKSILFPTDFSPAAQNAFRYCLRLADAINAKIELLHVVYPEYESLDLPTMATQATKDKVEVAREVMQTFVETGLTQVQSGYQFKKVPVIQSDVEIGGATNLIVQIAERDQADIIVMGTKGEHSALEKLLGSVSSGVIQKAVCPIWVIPEKTNFFIPSNIVFASDLTEADPMHIWKLAELISPLSPIIRCVHVHLPHEKKNIINLKDLENFFSRQSLTLQVTFHEIEEDDVAIGVQEFAELHRADLIVMFKPQENFLHRIFHVSNTRKMALHSNLPLLVLK
jgi:nucleotide-binding universal stress UspA family protein